MATKHAKFILDSKVWSDESPSTNDPKQIDFSWVQQLTGITLTRTSVVNKQIAIAGTESITLPISPIKYCVVFTDQPIAVRYNGEAGDTNEVAPVSAVGTVMDGTLFQTCNATSLDIKNKSATAVANVQIFMGG